MFDRAHGGSRQRFSEHRARRVDGTSWCARQVRVHGAFSSGASGPARSLSRDKLSRHVVIVYVMYCVYQNSTRYSPTPEASWTILQLPKIECNSSKSPLKSLSESPRSL